MSNLLAVYFYMGHSEGSQAWPVRALDSEWLCFWKELCTEITAVPGCLAWLGLRYTHVQILAKGPVWLVFISSLIKQDLEASLQILACLDGSLYPEFSAPSKYTTSSSLSLFLPLPSLFFVISSWFGWLDEWQHMSRGWWLRMLRGPRSNTGHPGETRIQHGGFLI